MLKFSLSPILILFSFLLNIKSFGNVSNNLGFTTSSSIIALKLNLKTNLLEDQVFVYVLESAITEENSLKIIDFISKRKGVNSCAVDRVTRKLVVTVNSEIPKNDIDGIVNYVQHNFFN